MTNGKPSKPRIVVWGRAGVEQDCFHSQLIELE